MGEPYIHINKNNSTMRNILYSFLLVLCLQGCSAEPIKENGTNIPDTTTLDKYLIFDRITAKQGIELIHVYSNTQDSVMMKNIGLKIKHTYDLKKFNIYFISDTNMVAKLNENDLYNDDFYLYFCHSIVRNNERKDGVVYELFDKGVDFDKRNNIIKNSSKINVIYIDSIILYDSKIVTIKTENYNSKDDLIYRLRNRVFHDVDKSNLYFFIVFDETDNIPPFDKVFTREYASKYVLKIDSKTKEHEILGSSYWKNLIEKGVTEDD